MHDIDNTRQEFNLEYQQEQPWQIGSQPVNFSGEAEAAPSLNEAEEEALAAELLGVSSEGELDNFLDGLFKSVLGTIGGAASQLLGKNAGPLASALKGLAGKALPFIGGALGSAIPIPGVGTALGSALGSAASKLLQSEAENLEGEDREFETAKRYVRFASHVIRNAAQRPAAFNPTAAINLAVRRTLQGWRHHHRYGSGRYGPSGRYAGYRDWRRNWYDRWGRYRGWYGPYGQYSPYAPYGPDGQWSGPDGSEPMSGAGSTSQWTGAPGTTASPDMSGAVPSTGIDATSMPSQACPPCPPCPTCPVCGEPSVSPSSPTPVTPALPIPGTPGGGITPPTDGTKATPGTGSEFEQEYGYAGESENGNYYDNNDPCAAPSMDSGRSGRWVRRGRKIILHGL